MTSLVFSNQFLSVLLFNFKFLGKNLPENCQKMKRNTYFDFLRGLAIMMVVGIHTYTLGKDSTVVRQLLNTAVPLFIAISGYFLSQKKMENKGDYISFIKRQLPKVYLPVLVWSLPLYALALYSGSSIIKQTILLLGCGFSIYYFVAFIMQCYVSLPVINICISGNKRMGGGDSELPYFICVGSSSISVHEYHSRKGDSTDS